MNNLESAYNQAMEMLKKGRSKEEVFLEFAEYKNELAPLLDISFALFTLPKNPAPRPAMQRKYALAPSKGFWLTWIHVSKFAGVSVSVMLLISALTVTGYAALKSGPGAPLFPVKKLAEQSQMLLAYNQEQQANIQIQITQNRLDDAQAIFSDPSSNTQQKTAALSELANQTSNAVAVVNQVAQNDPKSVQTSPLVNSLSAIAAEQKNLLTDINTPGSQVQVAASSALQSLTENSTKITEIQNLVAVADSNQSLTQLSSNPNAVAVLGQINQLTAGQITVEKTSFLLTPQTVITASDGSTSTPASLSVGIKVNVVGTQNSNGLIAQQILIIVAPSGQPEVKGASTTTQDALTSSTPDSLKKPSDLDKGQMPDQASSSSSSSTDSIAPTPTPTPTDSNTVQGNFILENPAPQFSPN